MAEWLALSTLDRDVAGSSLVGDFFLHLRSIFFSAFLHYFSLSYMMRGSCKNDLL